MKPTPGRSLGDILAALADPDRPVPAHPLAPGIPSPASLLAQVGRWLEDGHGDPPSLTAYLVLYDPIATTVPPPPRAPVVLRAPNGARLRAFGGYDPAGGEVMVLVHRSGGARSWSGRAGDRRIAVRLLGRIALVTGPHGFRMVHTGSPPPPDRRSFACWLAGLAALLAGPDGHRPLDRFDIDDRLCFWPHDPLVMMLPIHASTSLCARLAHLPLDTPDGVRALALRLILRRDGWVPHGLLPRCLPPEPPPTDADRERLRRLVYAALLRQIEAGAFDAERLAAWADDRYLGEVVTVNGTESDAYAPTAWVPPAVRHEVTTGRPVRLVSWHGHFLVMRGLALALDGADGADVLYWSPTVPPTTLLVTLGGRRRIVGVPAENETVLRGLGLDVHPGITAGRWGLFTTGIHVPRATDAVAIALAGGQPPALRLIDAPVAPVSEETAS